MSSAIFRFAPSPNGLLHLGHAYSAVLNAKMAREAGGRFLLRIEDTDLTRAREEFRAAILEDLAWLGLSWEKPVRVQSEHLSEYGDNLRKLWSMEAVYPCFCSRKQALAQSLASRDPEGQPHYGGTCRSLSRSQAESRIEGGAMHGWRLDTHIDPAASAWGDAMIAKPTAGSSYHIAVVTDDAAQGITHVVRGKDIEPATTLHNLLQRLLGLPIPHYHHHELILDESGKKLSKSRGSTPLRHLRQAGITPDQVLSRLGFA
jgi:glutamyl-Q tRNA(Asp) synthetase